MRLDTRPTDRASRARAPRHAPRGPRAAHPCVHREQADSVAPKMMPRREQQRANGLRTRAQQHASASDGGSAPILRTAAPQITVLASLVVVPMNLVAAGVSARTFEVAVGGREARTAAGGRERADFPGQTGSSLPSAGKGTAHLYQKSSCRRAPAMRLTALGRSAARWSRRPYICQRHVKHSAMSHKRMHARHAQWVPRCTWRG